MSEIITILPIELTNRNDGRGYSWHRTAAEKKRIQKALANMPREPFSVPVRITVTRILGKGQRLWDYDSGLRGNWKEIQDTLVNLGWFHDDSPKWIKGIVFEQDDTNKANGPAIELKIRTAA